MEKSNGKKQQTLEYLSLIDICKLSHSMILSFVQPAATCGLAKSAPAYPKSNSKTIIGEMRPSISIGCLDNSSGVIDIKLDIDLNSLLVYLCVRE